jgi:hypothetical protein
MEKELMRGRMNMQWISTVRYQDPATQTYLGSPSILRLDNGDLLATHDYFGPGLLGGENKEKSCLTSVYRSHDDGHSWQQVTHIIEAYWSSLFKHEGGIYLLGTSGEYGDIVIRRSDDNGCTWTYPRVGHNGLLFKGGPGFTPPNYHCSVTPVMEYKGRLYRAFEDNVQKTADRDFEAFVISCDVNADLLDAANWSMSNKLPYDKDIDPPGWGERDGKSLAEWIEGNMVEGPAGELLNILRVRSEPASDYAAIMRVNDLGRSVTFNTNDFIAFPGGTHKFTLRKDPETRLYWTLSNKNTVPGRASQRNILSLHVSKDLLNWEFVCNLMSDDQGLSEDESLLNTGFQYADWQFDGDDIIYLVRTAYRGAHNFHDSNYITYGCVKNYRAKTPNCLL